MANGKRKIEISPDEFCKQCPYHSGMKKGLEMAEARISCIEKKAREDTQAFNTRIDTKVGMKSFWSLVIIIVAIGGGLFGTIWKGQMSYQISHTALHKDINNEIKHMNIDLQDGVNQLQSDVAVIKALAEKNGKGGK